MKKESNKYIQSLASKAIVRLLNLLFKLGKVKPAQQILQLLIKDIEVISYPNGSSFDIQDRGIGQVFKSLSKASPEGNVLLAFNSYLFGYLSQPVTLESYLSLARVLNFFTDQLHTTSIDTKQVYKLQVPQLVILT